MTCFALDCQNIERIGNTVPFHILERSLWMSKKYNQCLFVIIFGWFMKMSRIPWLLILCRLLTWLWILFQRIIKLTNAEGAHQWHILTVEMKIRALNWLPLWPHFCEVSFWWSCGWWCYWWSSYQNWCHFFYTFV